jgi:hypothetical protein
VQPPRPASSAIARQAEEDLEQAAQQLTARRRQEEDDLALEFVRRFQAELGKMVKRQQQVVNSTVQLDAQRQAGERLDEAATKVISNLAREERELTVLAREHEELLFGLAAVRIGLQQAERRLADSARLLETNDTGPRAQEVERLALARLQGMFEGFAQTADEAAPNNTQQGSNATQPGQQPQRRPTFELLQVKMLRMLQADLNERTREYRQRLAAGVQSETGEKRVEQSREAQQLQNEQGQLAELVDEMLNRDNEVSNPSR